MQASNNDKQSQSRRTTKTDEPKLAASKRSRNSTSQAEKNARWTKEEYHALIDRALREYTGASSAITEAKDSQHGLRGGGKSDVEAESAAAVDTDQLDRKLTAHPRLSAEQGQIVTPQDNDVLFGRSRHQKNHAGNQYLRKLCDEQRSVYDLADRDDKTKITRNLVKKIASIGGRFLKFRTSHKTWVEVSDEEARHKVAHVMRDGRPQPLGRLEPEMFPPVR